MLGLTQPFEAIPILMNYTVMEEGELRKGPWLEEEDDHLAAAVAVLGDRKWDALAKASGLRRNGKSCRLRWMNYLRPNLKHGNISAEEEETIIQLHKKWGNRWSKIARRLPGRTDNEIKNFWRSYSKKRATLVEKECSSSATNASSPSMGKDTCNGFFDETGVTRSPYEARLTDWILSNKEDFSNFNLYSPEWNISLWDGE